MARHRTFITYLTAYLVSIGTAIRYLIRYRGDPYLGLVAALLVAFFLLLALEPWLSRRSQCYTHLYLVLQTGIAVTLSLIPPKLDYFSILFVTLVLQAVHVFPSRSSFRWIGAFSVIMTVFMFYGQGWNRGLPLVLIFVVIYSFFGSYATVARQAETARGESQRLLSELQVAHQQLQLYTAQAEELAVVQERSRLARNLHDSVTQTIFTMTLTAEAASLLFERDPARAAPQLEKLQELAQSALGEMRSLVFELRPTAVAEHGLIPALRHHIAMLEWQHGLVVSLRVRGEPGLPDEQAQRLFWVIQEALNNVVKHAQADKAIVALRFEGSRAYVQVEDGGIGFEPETIEAGGKSMGLSSMRERVEMMGGTLTVVSRPGEGTRITVEV
jgi:signal transduction histidine kinase